MWRSLSGRSLEGDIDLAVHSAKDLPEKLADGLGIEAVLKRGDPRDALVTVKGRDFGPFAAEKTAPGAGGSGTGAFYRRDWEPPQKDPDRGMVKASLEPDVGMPAAAGNVNTRLEKLW